MSWYKRLREGWRNYKISRAMKLIENEGKFRELQDRIIALEGVVKVREGDLQKLARESGEGRLVFEAKVRESGIKASQLEEELTQAKAKLSEVNITHQKLAEDYKNLTERASLLESGNASISVKLALAKKFALDYNARINALSENIAALEKERNDFERRKSMELESSLRERERETVMEHRKGLEDLANSYGALFKEVLEGVNEGNTFRSQFYSLILEFYEKDSSFGKSCCLFLDKNLTPVYATPGYCKFFEISQGAKFEGFPLKEEITEQSKNKPANVSRKSFVADWKGNEKRRPCKIDLNIRYVTSRAGNSLGIVVEYNEHRGTLGKILTFGGRKPAVERLEPFMDRRESQTKEGESSSEQS